ncbi:MAG TPA: hypothetical protein VGO43_00105 [Pyrinomonadaceae bacterium]|jgi:hypothetical protein|nr:hypothetical protein [Pyrinomonadaceae bacterium]
MSDLSIDYQDIQETCADCGAAYTVSRGSVYDDGEGASIYLAGLHQCIEGKVAHLVVAVRPGYEKCTEKCAAAIQIRNGGANLEMSLVDPDLSPWKDLDYLGRILTRDEVLQSVHKDTFFHIADHVVLENPTINDYLCS